MKILVTGINGFIGAHFAEKVLNDTDWEIQGFDLRSDNISALANHPRFNFHEGDLFKDDDWLREQVRACDVVLPLAGIAKPAYYLKKPLWTFELDFEQNLKIVRWCAEYKTRIVFPSTSEVYGLSTGGELKEDESPLITGPITKTRWIYSRSKQMMDQVIFAYGQEHGLPFSIFRPFNWTGPRLDTFEDAEEHSARAITQMIYDVLCRGTISLVDGGSQRRSFTWIGDAVEGLIAIIADEKGHANGEIFNIGNPYNNFSIRELAEVIIYEMKKIPQFREKAEQAIIGDVSAESYYGKNYDDIENRNPSIEKIKSLIGWEPKTGLHDMVAMTLNWYAARQIN